MFTCICIILDPHHRVQSIELQNFALVQYALRFSLR